VPADLPTGRQARDAPGSGDFLLGVGVYPVRDPTGLRISPLG